MTLCNPGLCSDLRLGMTGRDENLSDKINVSMRKIVYRTNKKISYYNMK
jgi:hypothetical protein